MQAGRLSGLRRAKMSRDGMVYNRRKQGARTTGTFIASICRRNLLNSSVFQPSVLPVIAVSAVIVAGICWCDQYSFSSSYPVAYHLVLLRFYRSLHGLISDKCRPWISREGQDILNTCRFTGHSFGCLLACLPSLPALAATCIVPYLSYMRFASKTCATAQWIVCCELVCICRI